jgi:hypothetical protein
MRRDVRLLIAAAAASRVGDSLSSVALAIVVWNRSHSPAWVAASAVVRIVPYLVLSPAAGGLAARWGFRRAMVVSDMVGAAVLVAIAGLVAGAAPVAVVVAVAALGSVAAVPFGPARRALTPLVTGPDGLAAANAALAAVDNVSLVVGPAAAALVVTLGSSAAAFALDGATFVVSAACVAFIRPAVTGRPEVAAPLRDRAGGVRAITASRPVAVAVAAVGLATLVYGIECVLFLLLAQDRLAMGPAGVGVLYAAVGVGGLAATRPAARIARPEGPSMATVVRWSMGTSGACLLMVAATRSPVAACLFLAVDGAANVVLEVAAVTGVQRLLAPDVTARVAGVMNSVVAAGFLAGFAVAPALVAGLGARGGLAAGGGLLVGSAVMLRGGAPVRHPVAEAAPS